jgi:hypothetical protein
MGKYEKKKTKKNRKFLGIICLLVLLVLLVFTVMPQVLYRMSDDFEQQENSQDHSDGSLLPGEDGYVPDSGVAFPVILLEGDIEIESLFQFSGINPDAQKQEVTDVASIVLKNTSGRYLDEATVTATLASGRELTFVLRDLPDGTAAMAFSAENHSLLETDVCTDLTAEATFGEAPGNNGAEITVEGMTVTVTNTSSEDMNQIDVYYRDVFDEQYFGGVTYIYTIDNLAAGETMTFSAEESLLGVIEVVRVAVNDKN